MDQLTLLALDTATEYCSVSLLVKGQRFVRSEKVGNGHSQLILPWIDEVLKEAGIALRDVDGILFGAGPGAFTGLRIACGVAQGLAYGADKKLLPVCNLEALAHHAFEKSQRVAVMNDARMGECYAAVYERRPTVSSRSRLPC
ncbi:MAG: tRNA (adenosine(37)-N6)-threonylcarbamoyltransferase complex dimerization subunit type 1 TsaB [Burkholderiaceae bacterium]|nr:tRNA (adenosine(37)-N6)-threonylcarbamoyltransferase complex dimerization subunit type 1 TsaB [Burkholderiaceae bacterium]